MSGWTSAEEAAILDGWGNDPAYVAPATRYLALSTTTPTEAGANFTEPSGNNYARVAVTAAEWAAAVAGDPSTKANGSVLSFPMASGSWGSLTHWGFFDASSGGTAKAAAPLDTAKTVGSGDTAAFAAGALVLQLGDPTDTY